MVTRVGPIDEYPGEAGGQLLGALEGGPVGEFGRVKEEQVGVVPGEQGAPVPEP